MLSLLLIQDARMGARAFSPSVLLRPGLVRTSISRRSCSTSAGLLNAKSSTATEPSTAATESLDGERFVVFNRFNTRGGSAPAAFEKRWANRKSSLAKMEGFRFFTLLRRCEKVGGVEKEYEEGTPDYMSMTVWEDKETFNKWRKGPAFKDAHGGGTVMGVLDAVWGVITELKGMPLTAAWDGLSLISVPSKGSALIEIGERNEAGMPVADGQSLLPAECFVSMNRMTVAAGNAAALEKHWDERESSLSENPGFVGFTFMRKRGDNKKTKKSLPDDVFDYSTLTVWASKAHFEAWRAKHFAEKDKKQGGGASETSLRASPAPSTGRVLR